MLDEREVVYLQTLKENPIWRSILRKIAEQSQTPRYRTGKDESIQVSDWKYQSGRLDEREAILSLLSKTKVNLEKANE